MTQRKKFTLRLDKAHNIVATWFYLGLFPIMPGTIGSLGAYPIFWIFVHIFGSYGYINPHNLHYVTVFLVFIGWWAITLFHEETGAIDHKSIVIDEVIGQLIVLAMCHNKIITYFPIEDIEDNIYTQTNLSFLICFLVFRFFDIKKPWIIGYIDKEYKGSLMVIMDDIMAALFGVVTIYIICILYAVSNKLF